MAKSFSRAESYLGVKLYSGTESFLRAKSFLGSESYLGAEPFSRAESYSGPAAAAGLGFHKYFFLQHTSHFIPTLTMSNL